MGGRWRGEKRGKYRRFAIALGGAIAVDRGGHELCA